MAQIRTAQRKNITRKTDFFFFHASRYFLVPVQVSLAVGEISLFVFLPKNIQEGNEVVRKNVQEHLNHLSK